MAAMNGGRISKNRCIARLGSTIPSPHRRHAGEPPPRTVPGQLRDTVDAMHTIAAAERISRHRLVRFQTICSTASGGRWRCRDRAGRLTTVRR
jgi:hypothetical protein